MPTIDRKAYRPREVAEALGVAEDTVRIWIKDGELAHSRIGRCVFIPAAELDRRLQPAAASKAA